MRILGLNQLKKPRNWPASSLSSREGSCDKARAPDSRMAGMIRALAYITKTRYASEMMTEGVMVMTAPMMRLKAEWIIVGSVDKACIRVVYEAMMIGGSGGRAGCAGIGTSSRDIEGW